MAKSENDLSFLQGLRVTQSLWKEYRKKKKRKCQDFISILLVSAPEGVDAIFMTRFHPLHLIPQAQFHVRGLNRSSPITLSRYWQTENVNILVSFLPAGSKGVKWEVVLPTMSLRLCWFNLCFSFSLTQNLESTRFPFHIHFPKFLSPPGLEHSWSKSLYIFLFVHSFTRWCHRILWSEAGVLY